MTDEVAQFRLLGHERVLPNIDANIKCGNSLIGPDYYDTAEPRLFDEDQARRVNVFDWNAEFKDIMAAGGFDCVIGNPPYIRIHNLVDYYPSEVRHIQAVYPTAGFGKVDIYVPFIERGLQLLRREGVLGFIVPNKFLQADYGVGLRRLLTDRCGLRRLVDFSSAQVFDSATTYTCLLFATPVPSTSFLALFNPRNDDPRTLLDTVCASASTSGLGTQAWSLCAEAEQMVLSRVRLHGVPLETFADEIITGVKTGANDVFVVGATEALREGLCTCSGEPTQSHLRPYMKAAELKRYSVGACSQWLIYPYEVDGTGKTRIVPPAALEATSPLIWGRLCANRAPLEGRQKGALKGAGWYGLSFASSITMFERSKLVTADLAPMNSFALDVGGTYFPQGAGGGMGIVPRDDVTGRYLLGVLNSRLMTYYFQRISSRFQNGWYAYEPRYVRSLPIRPIDFANPADVAKHDKMVSLVETMLNLHKRLPEAKTPGDKSLIERQITATDNAIDRLVFDLYELSDEEIAVVVGEK